MLARLLNGERGRTRTIIFRFYKSKNGSILDVTDDRDSQSSMWRLFIDHEEWYDKAKILLGYNPDKDGDFREFLLDCAVSFRYKPHWNYSQKDTYEDFTAWRWK